MQTAGRSVESEGARRARGRFAFFSWFFALVGVGTAMLSLLLIGGGLVAWSSAVGLILLGLTFLGLICLCGALATLFRARRERGSERPAGEPGK
jgi:hypothetical protein